LKHGNNLIEIAVESHLLDN